MHLSDRGTRHRRPIERTKHAFHRLAVDALQGRDHLLAGKRRNAVLQACKLVGDVGGQNIATRGEHLSELDEDRSQLLQCEPQPSRAWRGQVAPEGDRPRSRPQPVKPLMTEQELVEPVLERDEQNLHQPEQSHAAIVRDGPQPASWVE